MSVFTPPPLLTLSFPGVLLPLQSVEEMHITLQESKRRNRVVLSLLRNFAEENAGIMDAVADALEDSGLKLPATPRPGSRSSSRGEHSWDTRHI